MMHERRKSGWDSVTYVSDLQGIKFSERKAKIEPYIPLYQKKQKKELYLYPQSKLI